MKTSLRYSMHLAALAALTLLTTQTASAADPDLKADGIKLFASPNGQVNQQVLQFTVTNVGAGDSPVPFAKMQITGGNASFSDGSKELLLVVPELKANGGTFTGFAPLAGPCDATIASLFVQATGETNFANNEFGPIKLCPDLPPPPPPDPGPGPDDLLDYGGCVCNPVPQTLDIELDAWRQISDMHGPAPVNNNYDRAVGFYQKEGRFALDSTVTAVTVLNIRFDLKEASKVPPQSVTSATITYRENAAYWTSGGGGNQRKAGCVTRIYATTTGWFAVDSIDQLPVRYLGPVDPAKKEIDVTEHIRAALADPKNPTLVNGFQLRGPVDSVDGNDETSCVSSLDDVTLHINYTARP